MNKLTVKSLYRNVKDKLYKTQHNVRSLTEHLHVVEHHCSVGRAHAVVGPANVCPRVALDHGVDQQVAEQEARVVVGAQVLPVLCPRDLRGGDAAGHTLQHQPLALGHHDGAGCRRINDARRF